MDSTYDGGRIVKMFALILFGGVAVGVFPKSACANEGTLSLETAEGCLGNVGDILEVELWMRNLTGNATGFQAFLEFDHTLFLFRDDLSNYTNDPFPLHLQSMANAEMAPGELDIDGAASPGDQGTSDESLLATLAFEVMFDCEGSTVRFRAAYPFESELSLHGWPLVTELIDTPPGILLGDMNCDTMINGTDIQVLVDYIVGDDYTCQGDMNKDGSVDMLDVQGFVTALLAQ